MNDYHFDGDYTSSNDYISDNLTNIFVEDFVDNDPVSEDFIGNHLGGKDFWGVIL